LVISQAGAVAKFIIAFYNADYRRFDLQCHEFRRAYLEDKFIYYDYFNCYWVYIVYCERDKDFKAKKCPKQLTYITIKSVVRFHIHRN